MWKASESYLVSTRLCFIASNGFVNKSVTLFHVLPRTYYRIIEGIAKIALNVSQYAWWPLQIKAMHKHCGTLGDSNHSKPFPGDELLIFKLPRSQHFCHCDYDNETNEAASYFGL
jgi:hypothetical protein